MKKRIHTFLFSLLVLAYIATSTGVCIYYHYCGGELEKVSAMVKAKSCCSDSSDDTKDGCCRNESKYIGLKADFDTAKGQQHPAPSFTQLFSTPSFYNTQLGLHPQALPIFHHDLHPADPVGMAIVRSTVFRI